MNKSIKPHENSNLSDQHNSPPTDDANHIGFRVWKVLWAALKENLEKSTLEALPYISTLFAKFITFFVFYVLNELLFMVVSYNARALSARLIVVQQFLDGYQIVSLVAILTYFLGDTVKSLIKLSQID